MPPKFRIRTATATIADSPERLFDDLPRSRGGTTALWAHQADALRIYHRDHLHTPDVALELPTGAGKTLPGLLIGEWRRRSLGNRVLYACPTHQLARQTAQAAGSIGIDTVTLIGNHHTWPTADKLNYESARVMGITTYSAVFNIRPAVEPAQVLVFDDAHAAEQFVAGAWSVDIKRSDHADLYREILAILRPALSEITFQRLIGNDDGSRRAVHLISVAYVRKLARDITASLRSLNKGDGLYWRSEALGDRLDRCQIYVSFDGILIRPFIPPTSGHEHFTTADQRLYLSATLGEGGELERAFGRSPIARLAMPDGWDGRGAGRRFVVFPDLQNAVQPRELARSIVAEAGKALVLSPSTTASYAAADLKPEGATTLGPNGAVEILLSRFRAEPHALLTLASRYDGLDLPDAQCRVTVLDGMPSGAHLQEKFLSETLLAGRVLRERHRTRIVQGAGRCTRGLSDHSIVIVLGDTVTRFLNLPDVHDALGPELQAEVDFGRDNSTAEPETLLEFVRSFLKQDQTWREEVEPALSDARKDAVRTSLPENNELAAAAAHEVKAMTALWSGDWTTASACAMDAAAESRSAALSGYRALWMYFAASWLAEAAAEEDNDSLRRSALDLLRKAHAVARRTPWLREVQPLPADERVLDPIDEDAIAYASRHGPRLSGGAKWATLHTTMLANLGQLEARKFEQGLVTLGRLLGAESYKPAGNGRTDAAWIWDQKWWLAIEAKTEENPDSPLSLTTVRQANDQLKTLAHDRNISPPPRSAVLVVGRRGLVDPTAAVVAEPFVHLSGPAAVLELAQDAVAAWKQIRARGSGLEDAEAINMIRTIMSGYHILPSDVRARLLSNPIQG